LNTLKTYYHLTKPGIIQGNLLNTAAGFFFASTGHINLWLFLSVMAGTALVIASGCVFNNYIDQGIDLQMARTKKRALVTGKVSDKAAIIYSTILGLSGFIVLALFTNWLTWLLGVLGLYFYVVVYGFAKRKTVHGTLVGSISGALPIVAGYTAVTGHIDTAAVLLFIILACWQMPHFYAIAIYRLKDYKAAGLPVLPIKKGLTETKWQIVAYIMAFILACQALTYTGYTGYIFSFVMVILGAIWLFKASQGFKAFDDKIWARNLFFFSLWVILGLDLMLAVGARLP